MFLQVSIEVGTPWSCPGPVWPSHVQVLSGGTPWSCPARTGPGNNHYKAGGLFYLRIFFVLSIVQTLNVFEAKLISIILSI